MFEDYTQDAWLLSHSWPSPDNAHLEDLLPQKPSTAAERTTINAVKQLQDMSAVLQTSKLVMVHSQ